MLSPRRPLRRLIWRTGRKIYLFARRERTNNFALNGEVDLLKAIFANLSRLRDHRVRQIFDIGANVGDWSKHALEFVDRSSVASPVIIHAFEPIPQTFQRLKQNLAKDVCAGRIVLNQLGLGEEPGSAVFRAIAESHGTNRIISEMLTTVKAPDSFVTAKITSIDNYSAVRSIDRISFIKIDAEGSDFNVLLGAKRMMIAEAIDVLQFEYNHRWVFFRRFLKDVFDFIEGRPYKIGKLSMGRIELLTHWHPELERYFETNFVIAHERMLASLPMYFGSFDAANSYA